MKKITLAHGNGGAENNQLIERVFYRAFKNDILDKSEDAAIIDGGRLAFSSDSFTVSPLFFSGGDIGKLAICGTCNDLAMMGAKPKYLTCSVIIEEGFSTDELERIVESMTLELEKNGAIVVSGDTKVVPRGAVDKIFINTSGIGEVLVGGISANAITTDDVIIVSGDIGSHGATIFTAREGMEFSSSLKSDCKSLYPIVKELLDSGIKPTAMRDATRGGVAAVLNEWAKASNISIEVDESSVVASDEVRGVCEVLGLDAMVLANEGTFLVAIHKNEAEKALEILQKYNENARVIASVTHEHDKKVILKSSWGTKRFLDMPHGEILPRIC